MNKRTSIVNISGDEPETSIQLGKRLGTDQLRRTIFKTIYGRGERPKSKKQIMKAAKIPDTKNQYVQNELNYLRSHHLIVRSKNDGSVKDGSKFLYGKDETVRAHRKEIIKYADNRKAAEAVATKRRPTMQGVVNITQITKRNLKKRKHLEVLYLTANPDPATPLHTEKEMRRVQEVIRGSRFRDNITIHYRPASDLNSLIDGLNDHRPQIVHFSGHGNEHEIATDNGDVENPAVGTLPFDLFARALTATDSPPRIVILNSCKSSAAKRFLLPSAEIIITMQASITDIAASAFAPRFYAAIAAGQSVNTAFEQGRIAVEIASITEASIPELHCAGGLDPATVLLT